VKGAKTIVIDINLTRGLVGLLALSLLAAAFVGYLAWGQGEVAASDPQAPFDHAQDRFLAASISMRRYYLTLGTYNGADADGNNGNGAGVCAEGYHFASLWEILDPSNLKYDTALGITRDDSGQGPPNGDAGWVRTGNGSSTDWPPGQGNCAAWTSNASDAWGSNAALSTEWGAGQDARWVTNFTSCNSTFIHVWCVADDVSTSVFLPIILKN
jgi:hypothetical protein